MYVYYDVYLKLNVISTKKNYESIVGQQNLSNQERVG